MTLLDETPYIADMTIYIKIISKELGRLLRNCIMSDEKNNLETSYSGQLSCVSSIYVNIQVYNTENPKLAET